MREQKYVIAENIKKYRKKIGVTQMELAEKADLSIETIKCIETSKRTMSLDSFLRISHVLKVSPVILISEEIETIPYIERFELLIGDKSVQEIEYLLDILEHMAISMGKYL